ncbi:autotransporter outer membrane beta-barrel domain-containing protein [Croceicoccus naphthovorans]|uniref:Uncharacterized protein n=1 Tax=Croceicoccus naphthovorans TaxID=1348774 RepID=A0A0G3XFL3_9SPHN|nr:autotransporter outer membrane beta-barrel domain-containing protein [Croceicoccus naphthovorans]AKM09431.1 hypothetical protein AB433_04650 [Croceicoccus naphthovorans]MBB3991939.1 outer membrane autotransporter protein [Croceicoccus naphthovorans]
MNLGLAASYQDTDFDLDRSGFGSGQIETINVLGYLGVDLLGLNLRAGGGYGWSNIDTQRSVAFGSFAGSLAADYDGKSLFAFAEAGFPIALGTSTIEPYVGIRVSEVKTEALAESGGPAALTLAKAEENASAATVGVRASSAPDRPLWVKLNAGYEHGFDDLVPTSTARFVDGDSFTVRGTPLAEDGGFLQAEVLFNTSATSSLGLVFDGFIGDHSQQVAGGVKFSLGF